MYLEHPIDIPVSYRMTRELALFEFQILTIFALWTMPSLLSGRVHFSFKGCLVYFFYFILFVIENPIYANSVDPDQGIHCLPRSHLWDDGQIWVKNHRSSIA